jgi:hypothetical protein
MTTGAALLQIARAQLDKELNSIADVVSCPVLSQLSEAPFVFPMPQIHHNIS